MISQKELPKLKARWRKIARVLKKLFPHATIALKFGNSWELLVAVELSAQCTDKKVNEITPALFKNYRKLDDYVRAGRSARGVREFEQMVRPCGFYHAKTKNILAAAQIVKEKHGRKLPKTMND